MYIYYIFIFIYAHGVHGVHILGKWEDGMIVSQHFRWLRRPEALMTQRGIREGALSCRASLVVLQPALRPNAAVVKLGNPQIGWFLHWTWWTHAFWEDHIDPIGPYPEGMATSPFVFMIYYNGSILSLGHKDIFGMTHSQFQGVKTIYWEFGLHRQVSERSPLLRARCAAQFDDMKFKLQRKVLANWQMQSESVSI